MENLREGLLLGFGNPLLDISATVDADFLSKYGLKANDAILAEENLMPLYEELTNKYKPDLIAGGSAQNTLRVAQWILQKPNTAAFFGCVGNDENATILEKKARYDGLNVNYQITDKEPTGTCAVLITGTNRSLVAHLAAANCFTVDHINKAENKKMLDVAKYIYISGFFLTVSPETIQFVAKQALASGKVLAMNLSAPFLSQFFKQPMMDAMPYVDILFGNETEAVIFAKEQNFNTEDVKQIALKICKLPKQNEKKPRIVIISQGAEPVLLAEANGKITEYAVTKLDQKSIVDTNGAGDAFAGGFLAQFIQERPLDVCVSCGIWCSTEIIKRSGCTFEGKPNFKI